MDSQLLASRMLNLEQKHQYHVRSIALHLVHLPVRPIANDLDQLEDSSRILQEKEATCQEKKNLHV